MTHPPHELSNLRIAENYFNTLAADDVSRRYKAGEKYVSTWYNRVKFLTSIDSVLGELNRFYPYQQNVQRTYELFQEKKANNQRLALTFSGISIVLVYQCAKQNYVMPILRKFGSFFKTHRLLRQYVWLAFFPYIFAGAYTNYAFLNQTEKLWQVHASRLNSGNLKDPEDSLYPIEKLPVSQVYSWKQPYTHRWDRETKWRNETDIMLAPDYSNIEQWEVKLIAEPSEEGEGQEGAGSASAEASEEE